MILVAHLLSNFSGVGPCGWHISSTMTRAGVISFPVMNPAPFSASWAEDVTVYIIFDITCMFMFGCVRWGVRWGVREEWRFWFVA